MTPTPFFLTLTLVINHDHIVLPADSEDQPIPPMPPKYGDLTELVMEPRGQAVVVTHNAMPADSTVASTLRH